MLKKIFFFFQSDLLFSISFFLALVASSFGRFDVHFIDFQVILTLFGLMLTINGLEKAGFDIYCEILSLNMVDKRSVYWEIRTRMKKEQNR